MNKQQCILICATVVGCLVVVACQRDTTTTTPKPTATPSAAQPQHAYSPFVVKVSSEKTPFDTISFKDVGLNTDDSEVQVVYETLAESLSLELTNTSETALSSEVVYSTEILNPANHTSCGSRHIYIDVWSQSSPAMWGYSLWSGCEEASRFAWKQIPRSTEQNDLTDALQSLTQDIALSLKHATHTNCFSKEC